MRCFELIKSVLDEAFDSIPGSKGDRIEEIRTRLNELSVEYSDLLNGHTIDYRDPVTRFAYVYRYVTSHSMMVYTLITSSPELSNLLEEEKITVSCIGGGPGSDLIGILKYLTEWGYAPFLKCYILDREKAWNESWADVDEKIGVGFRVSTNFMSLDVEDDSSWEGHTKYLKADLFTMVYFMSEVYCRRAGAKAFFQNLFNSAEPGALFLYIDNRDTNFTDWFDDLAESNGVKILKGDDTILAVPSDEDKEDLGEYYELFGYPKLKGRVSFRIAVKE